MASPRTLRSTRIRLWHPRLPPVVGPLAGQTHNGGVRNWQLGVSNGDVSTAFVASEWGHRGGRLRCRRDRSGGCGELPRLSPPSPAPHRNRHDPTPTSRHEPVPTGTPTCQHNAPPPAQPHPNFGELDVSARRRAVRRVSFAFRLYHAVKVIPWAATLPADPRPWGGPAGREQRGPQRGHTHAIFEVMPHAHARGDY